MRFDESSKKAEAAKASLSMILGTEKNGITLRIG